MFPKEAKNKNSRRVLAMTAACILYSIPKFSRCQPFSATGQGNPPRENRGRRVRRARIRTRAVYSVSFRSFTRRPSVSMSPSSFIRFISRIMALRSALM